MATITINGNSYDDLTAAFNAGQQPTSGTYYVLAPFGEPPLAGPPEYEEVEVSFPGVDGVATKRLGFRGRNIWAMLIVIGASKAAVQSSVNTMQSSFAQQARYTISMPGGTQYQGCKLARGAATQTSWSTIGDKVCCIVACQFRQLSLQN